MKEWIAVQSCESDLTSCSRLMASHPTNLLQSTRITEQVDKTRHKRSIDSYQNRDGDFSHKHNLKS